MISTKQYIKDTGITQGYLHRLCRRGWTLPGIDKYNKNLGVWIFFPNGDYDKETTEYRNTRKFRKK